MGISEPIHHGLTGTSARVEAVRGSSAAQRERWAQAGQPLPTGWLYHFPDALSAWFAWFFFPLWVFCFGKPLCLTALVELTVFSLP